MTDNEKPVVWRRCESVDLGDGPVLTFDETDTKIKNVVDVEFVDSDDEKTKKKSLPLTTGVANS